MTRQCVLIVVLVLSLVAALPVAAQDDADWCQLFDFTRGPQGWTLSYEPDHGKYWAGKGFTVTLFDTVFDGATDYEWNRSIRLHRDFSGTLTEVYIEGKNANYTLAWVDFDSEIQPSHTGSFLYEVQPNQTIGLKFDEATVTNRLGLEIAHPTDVLTVNITQIELCGTGTNPFEGEDTGGGVGGQFASQLGINLPSGQMFSAITDANDTINELPDDLSELAPSADGAVIFGYVKWLLSPGSADEWAGPFAPIFIHLYIAIGIMFTINGIYALAWAAVYVVRWVIALFHWFLRLADFVMQVIQAGVSIVLRGAQAILSVVGRFAGA